MAVAEDVCTEPAGAKVASRATEGTLAVSTAAQELRMKRGEFAIAVHLGLIRLTARPDGGRPRVGCGEIDRLRSQGGFPEALREKVRTVGTAEGAQQLGISPDRFTKLARAGCFTPITFYLNRYRAIVWLYLADELAGFAARESRLLAGRSPAWLLGRLEGGADCRARNWRSRRVERLLSLTEEPWARAAVLADTLDPVQLAEVVDDPYERAYLARLRPEPAFGPTGPALARDTMAHLMQADEPDEMLWRRVTLIMELDNARETRPAPSPRGEWRDFPRLGNRHAPHAENGHAPGPDSRADTGPVPAPAPTPSSAPVSSAPVPAPAPAPAPASVPAVPPCPGAAPGPDHAPTGVAEPPLGLLARIGLRRRASRAEGRGHSGPGRAPSGA
ncbi:DUF6397 family protein [Streptomyces sp. NPDC051658]|uniref:DUF6397 family protein n=1 Tax=Streptomyces sp. NPDC051658 TaxID=3365667 RepID=UPI0037BC5846